MISKRGSLLRCYYIHNRPPCHRLPVVCRVSSIVPAREEIVDVVEHQKVFELFVEFNLDLLDIVTAMAPAKKYSETRPKVQVSFPQVIPIPPRELH
jgi:hypothetical protein